MSGMESRIASLESRVAELERAMQQLVLNWMPWIRDTLEGLKRPTGTSQAVLPSPHGEPRVYRRNWKDYSKALLMRKQGMSIRQIGLKLGIPYSTCHNYFFLREDEEIRLRDAWERVYGPLDERALAAELIE